MSRVGDCYDSAMMESIFLTHKSECATEPYNSRAEARPSIFEYIELWHNRQSPPKAPLGSWLPKPGSFQAGVHRVVLRLHKSWVSPRPNGSVISIQNKPDGAGLLLLFLFFPRCW